uniref:Uncharacterized protein n=1 Tax=Utricularia reniformis TaxID=192314 RepID=A0A1Y0B361_9LAMI|nr:hypothetical protein AEK19_MT1695 [Utricularia reniformis]ART31876.1 hypothetical protein AEK19_MT1695 [Utricularia reniformis]
MRSLSSVNRSGPFTLSGLILDADGVSVMLATTLLYFV